MQASQVAIDAAEARTAPRTNLFLSAMIRFDGGLAPIRLRDLSVCGAKVDGLIAPARGTAVRITRAGLVADGNVAWREPTCCGVRFDQPVDPDAWLPGVSCRTAILDDEPVDDAQTPAAAPQLGKPVLAYGKQRAPAELGDALPGRLAEELAYVARLIEGLGDDLAADPSVVVRHLAKLQNIDISAQILGHVARLLVADHAEQAVAEIGMESLRKRLQRTALQRHSIT